MWVFEEAPVYHTNTGGYLFLCCNVTLRISICLDSSSSGIYDAQLGYVLISFHLSKSAAQKSIHVKFINILFFAGDTVNFQRVVLADRLFMIFLGLATFIIFMQFLSILRYNHTIAMLNTTLTSSASDLFAMGLVVVIVLAAFMSCAHLSFGAKMLEYSSIKNTILSLTSSFLGKFDFDDISSTAGFGGRIFLLIYLLTMILIFVNLFITLLCNFMDVVRQDDSVIPKDHEVVDYMLDSFKALVVSNDDESNQDDNKSRTSSRSDSEFGADYNIKLYRKSFSSD